MSLDGETIVTGAGDETLKFWKMFQMEEDSLKQKSLSLESHELR